MSAPSSNLPDSYRLAYQFLIGQEEIPYVPRESLGVVQPQVPQGYTLVRDVFAENPWLHASAFVPLAYFSEAKKDILICEAPKNPTLLKPQIIRHLWLHLHIASLVVSATLLAPETLRMSTLRPCIIGLKTLPAPCYPAAMSALRDSVAALSDIENLPF